MALPGFAKFFKKAADEEKEHAECLMKFQGQRGGRIILRDIKKPIKDEWGSGLEAMQDALELEKSMNKSLIELHKTANKHNDYQVSAAAVRSIQLSSKRAVMDPWCRQNLIGLTSIGYYGDVPLEWVFNLSIARFNSIVIMLPQNVIYSCPAKVTQRSFLSLCWEVGLGIRRLVLKDMTLNN